jgi:hypothetical protein
LTKLLHLLCASTASLPNIFSHLVASSSATGTCQQIKKAHLDNPPNKGLYVNLLKATRIAVYFSTESNNHRLTAPFSVYTIAANSRKAGAVFVVLVKVRYVV